MSAWLQRNKLPCAIGLLVIVFLAVSALTFTTSDNFGFHFLPPLTCTPTVSPTDEPTRTASPTLKPTPSTILSRTLTLTPTVMVTPTPTRLVSRILQVPVILQELPLSCEIAGMRMVASALLGDAPSEKELLACMPRNSDPYLGFRGDPSGKARYPDGTINWDNYGAYAPAVAETLNRCVLEPAGGEFEALAVKGARYEDVAEAVLDGYPVIVWVSKRQEVEETTINTPAGPVKLVFGEHVWVVIGYHEDGTFEVSDPYPQANGKQTFRVSSFPHWDLFDCMAVFVRPSTTQVESGF